MLDIVLGKNFAKQRGISKIACASLLKNLKEPKGKKEAMEICRLKNVLLHFPCYEFNGGICTGIKKSNGAAVFSFSDILHEQGFRRGILISKMRLAIAECRRLKAGFVVCSLAKKKSEQRNARELCAFMRVLGMSQHEIVHSCALLERLAGKK